MKKSYRQRCGVDGGTALTGVFLFLFILVLCVLRFIEAKNLDLGCLL